MSSDYKRVVLIIYWVDSNHILVLIFLFVRVWSYEVWLVIDLLVEIDAMMQQTPKLQLLSTTSNSIKSQDYNRSKDPFVECCVKQRCEREYSELSDLIYNDRSFVNFELSLVEVVMYLLIFISDVDVAWFFINEPCIIKKSLFYNNITTCHVYFSVNQHHKSVF